MILFDIKHLNNFIKGYEEEYAKFEQNLSDTDKAEFRVHMATWEEMERSAYRCLI